MARGYNLNRYRKLWYNSPHRCWKKRQHQKGFYITLEKSHKIGEVHDGKCYHGLDGARARTWDYYNFSCNGLAFGLELRTAQNYDPHYGASEDEAKI